MHLTDTSHHLDGDESITVTADGGNHTSLRVRDDHGNTLGIVLVDRNGADVNADFCDRLAEQAAALAVIIRRRHAKAGAA